MSRTYDLIIWGVTGFTGQLCARYLAETYPIGEYKIALAGRSEASLKKVVRLVLQCALESPRADVREAAAKARKDADGREGGESTVIPILAFPQWGKDDPTTDAAAEEMCRSTSVILTFAGPFKKCGEPIVRAAAKCGTDYVDSTGENLWVDVMIGKYRPEAEKNKSRFFFCSGYDYLLNDVGIERLLEMRKKEGADSECTTFDQLTSEKGSNFSTGTLKTGVEMLQSVSLSHLYPHKLSPSYSPLVWYSEMAKSWAFTGIMTTGQLEHVRRNLALTHGERAKNIHVRIGDRASSWCSAIFHGLLIHLMTLVLIGIAKIPFLRSWVQSRPQSDMPITQLRAPSNFVKFETFGELSRGRTCKHTVLLKDGEAYWATAIGTLETALSSACQRRAGTEDIRGSLGTATTLIGEPFHRRLVAAGISVTEDVLE